MEAITVFSGSGRGFGKVRLRLYCRLLPEPSSGAAISICASAISTSERSFTLRASSSACFS
jgi:hypothetical protein